MKENKKDMVSLDQIDAVCDELLKAFEQVDRTNEGVLDRSGFQRFLAVLSGKNVQKVNFQRSVDVGNAGAGTSTCFLFSQCSAANAKMRLDVSCESVVDLDERGAALLHQKKQELLAFSFEDIDRDGVGEISGDQMLEAVGLSVAVEYLSANAEKAARKAAERDQCGNRELPNECVSAKNIHSSDREAFCEMLFSVLNRFSDWNNSVQGAKRAVQNNPIVLPMLSEQLLPFKHKGTGQMPSN